MTYQEALWKDRLVWVTGIVSKSGNAHRYVAKYVGRGGFVEGQAKNGMLLIRFQTHSRSIPAGCVTGYTEVNWVKP